MIGSVADVEYAVLKAGGLSGSLSDMRLAYAAQADPTDVKPGMSVSDARMAWWSTGGADTLKNITDLERRYYLTGTVKFNANNSVTDLRFEKFGGNV